MAIDDKYFIDSSARNNLARCINRSCEPKAKAFRGGVRVWKWSLKDIKVGKRSHAITAKVF